MTDSLKRLLEIVGEAIDLGKAAGVLEWDQQTYMPPGGAEARAEQKATLEKLAHERFTQDEVGTLLARLEAEVGTGDSFEARLVRVTKREYDSSVKIPSDLVAAISKATSTGFEAWVKAKEKDDFSLFEPHLEHIVDLLRQKADALGYKEKRYDALLDLYEPDMTTAQVSALFAKVKERLVPLVHQIRERLGAVDDAVLKQTFEPEAQWQFGLEVLRTLGFDMERGRLDSSAHPFTIGFAPEDVRITTNVKPQDVTSALFSTIHEVGHGMYDQGIPAKFRRTLLDGGASLGVHESQSRLWENVVGRSREFWQYFLPRFKAHFPSQLSGVDMDAVYRAVNRVEPSFIRTEADEVTYNLHIFIRFELEQEMFDGDLNVADLPDAWNVKMEQYLGITPTSAAVGILQDVHWSSGLIGYFPTYTLGNILSVQLYNRCLSEHPNLPQRFAEGNFENLKRWMNEHIHAYGAMYTPQELVRKATGTDLDPSPYLDYIEGKYRALYGF